MNTYMTYPQVRAVLDEHFITTTDGPEAESLYIEYVITPELLLTVGLDPFRATDDNETAVLSYETREPDREIGDLFAVTPLELIQILSKYSNFSVKKTA